MVGDNNLFDLYNIRIEISFKSFEQLRSILSLYQRNNIYKLNIPCKNSLKKDFLLKSVQIVREEFKDFDIIPHFSILHEFRRNRYNTLKSLIEFVQVIKSLKCNQLLLISGSQKRSTLDSLSTLNFLSDNPLFINSQVSIGVAFNPYLPKLFFDEEIIRLERKLQSGLVNSIWIQFGTDYKLLENRINILNDIIYTHLNKNPNLSNIMLFGSILIPSKQFLARFKYRPWKGVYCSTEFLDSLPFGIKLVKKLLKTYKKFNICPLIETNISTDEELNKLDKYFNF